MGGLGSKFDVYLKQAEGNTPAQLLAKGAVLGMVRWDWSRNEILASGDWGTEEKTICRISPERGGLVPFNPPLVLGLKTMPSPVFGISRDGRLLVFTREESKGGIWMLEAVKGTF